MTRPQNGTNGHHPEARPKMNSAEQVFGRKTEEYEFLNQALGTTRHIKIIYCGGGASGINMAYKVRKHLQNVEFIGYEKNSKLGGTWFENKYPGCACDIPSHTYQFTWALNPEWNYYYSGTDEIEKYFDKVVEDFDLAKFFKVSHEIVAARWDESTSHWVVRIRPDNDPSKEFEDWCDVFINGSGLLNKWKWPDIEGLNSFKGKLVHTASYDPSLNLEGKKVALIGVGSSAVQVLPQIQPKVGHVYHFIRSKTWISPGFAAKYAGPGGSNFKYSEEQKQEFRKNPEKQREYSRGIEFELNKRWRFIIKDSEAQKDIFNILTEDMKKKLNGRKDLIDTLVPDFAVGCRRLTPAPGFLEALQEPNVTPVTSKIARITETGVETVDGQKADVDIIICATGFDISFTPRFPIVGKNNTDLRDQWADRARAYMSMFVPNLPNYIIVMGPGSPAAHGPLLASTEHVSDYTMKLIYRLQTEPIRSICVKTEVVEELFEHAKSQLKTTSWASTCTSWFKNGKADGNLDSLHPGGRLHLFSLLVNPRWEDFDYEYVNNRFAHLGNGFTQRELDERDLTWYLAEPDRLNLFQY